MQKNQLPYVQSYLGTIEIKRTKYQPDSSTRIAKSLPTLTDLFFKFNL
jgi:hypothetical protein